MQKIRQENQPEKSPHLSTFFITLNFLNPYQLVLLAQGALEYTLLVVYKSVAALNFLRYYGHKRRIIK